MLRGNKTDRTSQWGHESLSVFGVGAELNDNEWRNVFRQLTAMSYARPNHEAYGALQLTEAARPVLRGEVTVEMRAALSKDARRAQRKEQRIKLKTAVDTSNADVDLLAKLKSWRFNEAQSQGVPAFVIFHDSTLAGIASAKPATMDELSRVSGIGAKKLERYGEAILALTHGVEC